MTKDEEGDILHQVMSVIDSSGLEKDSALNVAALVAVNVLVPGTKSAQEFMDECLEYMKRFSDLVGQVLEIKDNGKSDKPHVVN